MASELRVNTLKDASGNNSVATSVVFNGTAKTWARLSSTGITESFNVSGFTDNGAGDYTITFTSAFSSNTFAGTTSPVGTAARAAQYSAALTTGIDIDNFVSTSGSRTDGGTAFDIHGDLA